MTKKKTTDQPGGYVEALRELEEIIKFVESTNVDIDVLEEKLKRASTLISWCNERIDATETVVETIIADFKIIGREDVDVDEDDDEDDEDFDEEDDEEEDFDEDDE